MTKSSLEEKVLEPELSGAVSNEKEEELKPPGLEDYVDERVLSGEVLGLEYRFSDDDVYIYTVDSIPPDINVVAPPGTYFVCRNHVGIPQCVTDTKREVLKHCRDENLNQITMH